MAISTAIDTSAVARVLGIKTEFQDLRGGNIVNLPQRVALVGQGATAATYSTTKRQVTTAVEVAQAYGFGSPLHLAAMQLFPAAGDGIGTIPLTVYPLEDNPSSTAASGSITPSGAQSSAAEYVVSINGINSEKFVIVVGDSVAAITAKMTTAINANLSMPIVATDNNTDVGIASKWTGTSANDLKIQVLGSLTAGTAFALTQPFGGLANPDVAPAIAQVGDVWETLFINCMGINDADALNKFATFAEGRWGAITRKPCIVFTGNTTADLNTAITVPASRATERGNCQLVAPGSVNLPLVVAARQVARIAKLANNTPPHDYGSQPVTGISPGTDAQQWTHSQRDVAVKAGSSTVEVKDGVVNMSDTVTFYHPVGEQNPAYRYVVDIIKLMNIVFNLNLIFANSDWDGAPLIPNDQPSSERTAKKPKAAVAAVAAMVDNLGLAAIISEPKFAKESIRAEIDSQNPKRLNVALTVKLSGNVNIISVDLDFGFFFGATVETV